MRNLSFVFLLLIAIPALCVAELKDDYQNSFQENRSVILQLIHQEKAQRADAVTKMTSSKYERHLENYLAYYRSLPKSYDLFHDLLSLSEIRKIQTKTQSEYGSLKRKFLKTEVRGQDFLHFFQHPTQYLQNRYAEAFIPMDHFDYSNLFRQLKTSLPGSLEYQATVAFDPTRPGGAFDEETNRIIFGTEESNISQILGFTHEFGHSVLNALDAPRDGDIGESEKTIYLSLKETYAELWARQICNLPAEALSCANDQKDIEDFLQFRNLITLKFHLMVTEVERLLRVDQHMNAAQYRELVQALGRKYLEIDFMPPFLPILPQSLTPGYLQAYAVMPMAAPLFESQIDNDPVHDLLKIGIEIKGRGTADHFREIFRTTVIRYKEQIQQAH